MNHSLYHYDSCVVIEFLVLSVHERRRVCSEADQIEPQVIPVRYQNQDYSGLNSSTSLFRHLIVTGDCP